jgi:hypothetical protein
LLKVLFGLGEIGALTRGQARNWAEPAPDQRMHAADFGEVPGGGQASRHGGGASAVQVQRFGDMGNASGMGGEELDREAPVAGDAPGEKSSPS